MGQVQRWRVSGEEAFLGAGDSVFREDMAESVRIERGVAARVESEAEMIRKGGEKQHYAVAVGWIDKVTGIQYGSKIAGRHPADIGDVEGKLGAAGKPGKQGGLLLATAQRTVPCVLAVFFENVLKTNRIFSML